MSAQEKFLKNPIVAVTNKTTGGKRALAQEEKPEERIAREILERMKILFGRIYKEVTNG